MDTDGQREGELDNTGVPFPEKVIAYYSQPVQGTWQVPSKMQRADCFEQTQLVESETGSLCVDGEEEEDSILSVSTDPYQRLADTEEKNIMSRSP